jgi:hypothetical protein
MRRSQLAQPGFLLGVALTLASCGPKAKDPPAPTSSPSAAAVQTVAAPSATASTEAGPKTRGVAGGADVCGAIACTLHDSPEDAFRAVLEREPRILAVGESHAPAGATVPSVTQRFTRQLLPLAQSRATHFVLELWAVDPRCNQPAQKAAIKAVASASKEITATQAQSNQGEFLALYQAAKVAGLMPQLLTPDCADYTRLADAGVSDVDLMLSLIASRTGTMLAGITQDPRAMVIAYGGAVHNDVTPRPGREQWSFGTKFNAEGSVKYIELDLVVPEFIGDSPAWKSQAFFEHYKAGAQGKKTVLYAHGPRSFTLVFPPKS